MFQSAKLKLERAKHHITDFEREVEAFIARKPHRFAVAHDSKSGKPIIKVRFVEKPPAILAVIIGDAIHNLRCVLDHMTWEIVGIDGGAQHKHLMFPPRKNRVDFESAVNGIQTPSSWVKDLLTGYEAFPGGRGEVFYTMHDLDIADKHQAISPVARATSHPPFKIFHSSGDIHSSWSGNQFIGMDGDSVRITEIPPGGHVELDDEANCPADVFIPEIFDLNARDALKVFFSSTAQALDEAQGEVIRNTT